MAARCDGGSDKRRVVVDVANVIIVVDIVAVAAGSSGGGGFTLTEQLSLDIVQALGEGVALGSEKGDVLMIVVGEA